MACRSRWCGVGFPAGVIVLACAQLAFAQSDLPAIKSLRYTEDYSAFSGQVDQLQGIDRLKFASLDTLGNIYLSLGGEFRERYQYTDAPLFGVRARPSEDVFLHRLLLHGDLHWRDRFRAFVQLGGHFQSGREGGPLATDEDDLDLQQAFGDFFLVNREDVNLDVRIGRQEMSFGSSDLVGVAERRNIRRSFDGVRTIVTGHQFRADVFLTRAIEIVPGIFDDHQDNEITFWGAYAVLDSLAQGPVNLDLYYLGLDRSRAVFDQGTGSELRHTLGTRLWGGHGAWDFNTQIVVQFGEFADANIFAWGIGTDTGYTFEQMPGSPRFGFKANIASGDDNPNDGRLNTFNALFPRSAYFSEAALIQPTNIFDLNVSLAVQATKRWVVELAWNGIWRASIDDAIYRSGPRPLIPGNVSDARDIGHQIELATRWRANRYTDLRLHYVHFFAGDAVKSGGGSDVDFFMTSLTLKF